MITKFNFLYYLKPLNLFACILISTILLSGCATLHNGFFGNDSPHQLKEEKEEREAIFGPEDETERGGAD